MAYPTTARYKIRFRNSDTGLTPTFLRYQALDTLAPILPQPAIVELGNGDYYFEHTWTALTDPDIDFCIDGGAAIPTEEIRYISDVISARDYYTPASGGGGGGAAWTVG